MYEVEYTELFENWLISLQKDQAESIAKLIGMLEIKGYELPYPYSRKIEGSKYKLRELRCKRFGNRAYYTYSGNKIYICLNGGNKSSQKRDIKKSEKMAKQIHKLSGE